MMVETRQDGSSLTTRAAWLMLARTLAFLFSFALPLLLVRHSACALVGGGRARAVAVACARHLFAGALQTVCRPVRLRLAAPTIKLCAAARPRRVALCAAARRAQLFRLALLRRGGLRHLF